MLPVAIRGFVVLPGVQQLIITVPSIGGLQQSRRDHQVVELVLRVAGVFHGADSAA